MTPVGWTMLALVNAIKSDAGPLTLQERCASLELALRDLIKKEMVIHNILVDRTGD